MRVFITGDTHGNFQRIIDFCEKQETSKDDLMVILGDAGINYYLSKRDQTLKKSLSELPITLFCIHGNHEERPYLIPSYQEISFCGGMVYQEPAYPNLLFAKDGEIYEFLGKSVLVIGGAYSVDKFYRLARHFSWFPSEQPDETIKKRVEKKIEEYGKKVDYVWSHTCPISAQPRHLFLSMIDQSTVDSSTEEWLETIAEDLSFEHWYFGHYHGDWTFGKYRMFYNDILEMGEFA